MDQTTERLSRTIWVGVGLIIIILSLAFVMSRVKPRPKPPVLPVISQVADFNLTNQDGRTFTLTNLLGKVWVGDIIFTRCPGPCARMTKQMATLQAALPPASQAHLVSLTTDPEYDTPEILKKYADHFKADATRWDFLTGPKLTIAAVAVDGLKLTALEKKPEERTSQDDLFIHSTIFVVVDKHGRLRASFETEAEGYTWPDIQAGILKIIRQLENEP